MNIRIIIEDESGEIIAQRETDNWEIAEQNLESLKKWHKKERKEIKKQKKLEV